MYNYFLLQWRMRKINEVFLTTMVELGHITQTQKETILSTPQIKR